ncbi:hypothetical protein [Halorhabdus rudnickae]|uniref:hypothetical protein n=1 Tax=Halorhabdus rudnickae TaxID=1775544 RepID=UPI001082D204|nr:hypothetical protein [Halorhabdus rudnickae]
MSADQLEPTQSKIRRRKNDQYDLPLGELSQSHDFSGRVNYSIVPKWADAGRETNLVYEARPGEGRKGNTRSVLKNGEKFTIRFPKTLLRERGLLGGETSVTLLSPEEGRVQIVLPEPFEHIHEFHPVDNVASKEKIPTKRMGPGREYEKYRLFLPTQYNRHYEDLPRTTRWSLAIAGGQPALAMTFIDEDDVDEENMLVSKRRTKISGESGHQMEQIAVFPPIGLVDALGWYDSPVGLIPEEDRIVFVPDPAGSPMDLK